MIWAASSTTHLTPFHPTIPLFVHRPPDWLNKAVLYMSMTNEGLGMQRRWIKPEFVDKLVFCQEFNTEILPDASLMANRSFRGMMFSVY